MPVGSLASRRERFNQPRRTGSFVLKVQVYGWVDVTVPSGWHSNAARSQEDASNRSSLKRQTGVNIDWDLQRDLRAAQAPFARSRYIKMVFRTANLNRFALTAAAFLFLQTAVHAQTTGPAISDEIAAQYLQTAIESRDNLLNEYRVLLEVYYEYKSRSENPRRFANPMYDPELAAELPPNIAAQFSKPFSSSVDEFSNKLYEEFKAELDSDPRLRGNSYRDFMRGYGGSGKDNDVLQRFSRFYRKSLAGISDETFKAFQEKIGNSLDGTAMFEAKKIFADTGRANGYPRNRQVVYQPRLRLFRSQMNELKRRLPPPTGPCSLGFKELGRNRS